MTQTSTQDADTAQNDGGRDTYTEGLKRQLKNLQDANAQLVTFAESDDFEAEWMQKWDRFLIAQQIAFMGGVIGVLEQRIAFAQEVDRAVQADQEQQEAQALAEAQAATTP